MVGTDTILGTKRELAKRDNLGDVPFKIFFGDKELFDDQNLDQVVGMGFDNSAPLDAKGANQASVQLVTKRIVPLDFELTDTVLGLKKKLHKDEGIPWKDIVLIFQDHGLFDTHTMDFVVDKAKGEKILLIVKEKMDISVKMLSGTVETRGLAVTETVWYVKELVSKKDGVKP